MTNANNPRSKNEALLRAWLKKQGVNTAARGLILCELVECELGVDWSRNNVPTRTGWLVKRLQTREKTG